jgi:hypothetical protein
MEATDHKIEVTYHNMKATDHKFEATDNTMKATNHKMHPITSPLASSSPPAPVILPGAAVNLFYCIFVSELIFILYSKLLYSILQFEISLVLGRLIQEHTPPNPISQILYVGKLF